MSTLSLFNDLTTEQLEATVFNVVKAKCKSFHMAFGIWKNENGTHGETYTMECTSKKDATIKIRQVAEPCKDYRHALQLINKQLNQL